MSRQLEMLPAVMALLEAFDPVRDHLGLMSVRWMGDDDCLVFYWSRYHTELSLICEDDMLLYVDVCLRFRVDGHWVMTEHPLPSIPVGTVPSAAYLRYVVRTVRMDF